MCFLLLAFSFLPGFSAVSAKENSEDDYDSLIVVPSSEAQRGRRLDRLMYRAGIVGYRKVKSNLFVIPLSSSEDKVAKIQELKNSGLFKTVEPDYKFYLDEISDERNYIKINIRDENAQGESNNIAENVNDIKEGDVLNDQLEITPNDSDFSSQYYLRQINAPKAWGTTKGNSLVVGVLDTGVDANHPDLEGKIFGSENLLPEDKNDAIGHGTEVSGIIAANTNNKQGIAGVSWNTKILPIKVTDEYGQARVSTVVEALDRTYTEGVKIVQISLSTSQFSQVLKDSVQEANERGILIISTAGNTGEREVRYPAAFEGVIGVGAVNSSKKIESYSTLGDHVSLVAPGASIYTTSLYSGYSSVSGTSFAAPQVAGTAALIWSVAPDISSEDVRQILFQSAEDLGEPGKDFVFGNGLLNTEAAVNLAKAKYANNIQIEKNLFFNVQGQ